MSAPAPTDRRLTTPEDLHGLVYDERGLLPVVAQDARSGAVLMLAWANEDALLATFASGELTFWSRSRAALWRKGETSGNVLRVRSLFADCDKDAVLALVEPAGPACHTGDETCFGAQAWPAEGLEGLWKVLEARAAERPEGSYTTRLLGDDNLRIKKLGEECAELIAALARGQAGAVRAEAADLLYHLLVALLAAGVPLPGVLAELESRRR
jgi:phosphoribosyl-ATP pyrophosphohydrolase/phosphoribosyl-AMP cyclohydrolase